VQNSAARPASPRTYLDFEKSIADLEIKVSELRTLEGGDNTVSISEEIRKLEQKAKSSLVETYSKLTPWQKTLVARHPDRPHTMEFIDQLVEDFTPLAGDRYFAEDEAIMGGMGRFRNRSVMVIGNEKGADTEGRIRHNFGMAKPEGYRGRARSSRSHRPVYRLLPGAGRADDFGCHWRRRLGWCNCHRHGQPHTYARTCDL
jgi:acetyl-CoA carboxylase carboxyl transferase subunit alpha